VTREKMRTKWLDNLTTYNADIHTLISIVLLVPCVYNKSTNWPKQPFPKNLGRNGHEYNKLSNPFIVCFLSDAVEILESLAYLLKCSNWNQRSWLDQISGPLYRLHKSLLNHLLFPQVSSVVIILMYYAPTKFLWTHA